MPQLLVSGLAARRGEPQIAIGSLVGSIIAACCLALAASALFAPIEVDSKAIRREVPLSVAAVVSLGLLALGGLSHFEAKVLMVLALSAIGILVVSARSAETGESEREVQDFYQRKVAHRAGAESGRAFMGVGLMIAGADLLVASASGAETRLVVADEAAATQHVGRHVAFEPGPPSSRDRRPDLERRRLRLEWRHEYGHHPLRLSPNWRPGSASCSCPR